MGPIGNTEGTPMAAIFGCLFAEPSDGKWLDAALMTQLGLTYRSGTLLVAA